MPISNLKKLISATHKISQSLYKNLLYLKLSEADLIELNPDCV